jgi:predicted phage-related endonuclease
VSGRYSASFDGLTMMGDVAFEHKLLGQRLRDAMHDGCTGTDLPLDYQVQMEHQLMVSGAERVLFMASKWERDETAGGEYVPLAYRYCWYTPNPELRARIVAGWEQFAAELADYVPTEAAAPVVPAPMESLPAVVVQVQGALTVAGNLPAFGQALRSFIERIPLKPATDQQFADAEAACKALKKAEDALTQAEDGALAQISDVEQMRRAVADLRNLARTTRLATEKLVKAEKDARRTERVVAARQAFDKHVAACQLDIKGVRLNVPMPDFGAAIKGLSSLSSIDDKLKAALIAGQAEVNTLASKIIENLRMLDSVPQHAHLFADRQELAYKDAETLELLMQKRVDAEAARLEAERQRIQAEAERKAKEAAERQSVQPTALHGPHGTVAYQADGMPAEGRAKFDHDPRFAAVVAGAPAPQVDEPATLKLRSINERLEPITLTEAGIRSLGIEPAGHDRRAVLYRESDFLHICSALMNHLRDVAASLADATEGAA